MQQVTMHDVPIDTRDSKESDPPLFDVTVGRLPSTISLRALCSSSSSSLVISPTMVMILLPLIR
jgi:hypothetical protein